MTYSAYARAVAVEYVDSALVAVPEATARDIIEALKEELDNPINPWSGNFEFAFHAEMAVIAELRRRNLK